MSAFEIFNLVLKLLCGVSLFLYGMTVMGDGLKKVAGNKLEALLYKLTSTPIKGIILGAGVTAVIQSSSATTVMVVGFVNSGMMKVGQAIGIIMGANIGTSITGWILCLSYIEGSSGIASILSTATISALVAIIGVIFMKFLKKDAYHHLGEIMLGFAVLMTGMQTMSGAVSPLKEIPAFINVLTTFSNPVMGIIVGIAFTAVLQSASASVGILQALSMTGAISFAVALPITMGIGVGAACPVLLSSIGTSKNGKRTALIYLLNDLFGMLIGSIVFYSANAVVGGFPFLDITMGPVQIALMNTVFRIATICVLAPFIKLIEKLVFVLIKESEEDMEEQRDFELLEERFLNFPDLAIANSHTAINGMAVNCRKNFFRATNMLKEYDSDKHKRLLDKESLIDKYEDKLGTYLMQVIRKELSTSQTQQTSKFLHTISDFERISDHACGIGYVAKEIFENKIEFSKKAQTELDTLFEAVGEIINTTEEAFVKDDLVLASNVEPLRQYITTMCNEMKSRHIYRMQAGKCGTLQGFPFNDLLTNADRIASHCSNIAVAMIELESTTFDAHAYVKSIQSMKNDDYQSKFNAYAEKYPLPEFGHEIEIGHSFGDN